MSKCSDSLSRLLSKDIDAEVHNTCPIIPEGIDPTTLVLPLQLMKSHLTKCHINVYQSRLYSGNYSISIGDDLASSRWLDLEFEDLLCWIYELSAKTIRKRQSTREKHIELLDGEIDVPSGSRKSSGPSGLASRKSWSLSDLQAKRIDYSLSVSPAGILRATLGTILNKEANANTSDGLIVLDLKFIPGENERTRGVCVTFARTVNELAVPRICPHITVFNIVPDDSEMIRCVSRNDLQGIQKLFERRQASPTDVDKDGFSLLSVRIQAVSSNLED